jgi:hypothetical protein
MTDTQTAPAVEAAPLTVHAIELAARAVRDVRHHTIEEYLAELPGDGPVDGLDVEDIRALLASAVVTVSWPDLAAAVDEQNATKAAAGLGFPRRAQKDDLEPWIRRAVVDPGSIAGPRRSPEWGEGAEGYAEVRETFAAWTTRAILRIVATDGRPHCERCDRVIRVDDAWEPPLPGVGLWEHKGACPPRVASAGCDDCSVEPGERHRYPGCPGNQRAIERTGKPVGYLHGVPARPAAGAPAG